MTEGGRAEKGGGELSSAWCWLSVVVRWPFTARGLREGPHSRAGRTHEHSQLCPPVDFCLDFTLAPSLSFHLVWPTSLLQLLRSPEARAPRLGRRR